MYERESVARELDETPHIVNLARGGKVLEITKSKPKKAEIIEFPGAASFEAMVKKVKENLGLKKLVATTIIGLTAAMGATALSGVTAKNDDKSVIEFEEDANSNNIVKINPAVDNIVTVGSTKIAPPVVITTPETEAASEAETEPTVEIESISESEATYEPEVAAESEPDMDSDFAFKQTSESTPESVAEPTSLTPEQAVEQTTTTAAANEAAIAAANEAATTIANEAIAQATGNTTATPISSGLDIAMRTAFSEGAYNSEEDARKIADVIINRAVKNGTSVGVEVAKDRQFTAYKDGMNGHGNWGWREYGSGPQNGSIGTERVQQIFMEELNKAILGQPLAYGYTGFGASGDGRTNTFH